MPVIDLLASSLNRRDEEPNIELAKQIAANSDKAAVNELLALLSHKDKQIQSDAIKVVYEIAEIQPKLVADNADGLKPLLTDKNNRLQWGAMTALNAITSENPKAIWSLMPDIMSAAETGSVITNDQCVGILIKFSAMTDYADDAFSLLNEKLLKSPGNQLPMYAENSLPVITKHNKERFIKTLSGRISDMEKETKKKRIEKVIKKALAI